MPILWVLGRSKKKKMGKSSFIDERIKKIRINDTKEARLGAQEELGILFFMAGGYMNLDRGLTRSVVLFIFYLSHLLLIGYCFFMTLARSKGNYETLTQSFHLFIIVVFCSVILVTFFLRRPAIARALHALKVGFTYDDFGTQLSPKPFEEESIKIKKYLFIGLPIYVSSLGMISVVVGPLVDYLSGIEVEDDPETGIKMHLPIAMWVPFDVKNPVLYYSAAGFQFISASVACVVASGGIVPYIFINQRVLQHMKLLMYAVENVHIRSLITFKKQFPGEDFETDKRLYENINFQKCCKHSWKQIAQHHQFILKLLRSYQDVATKPAVFILLSSSIMVALSCYGAIAGSEKPGFKLQSILFAIIEIIAIGIVSWYGEETGSLGQRFRWKIYFSEWPDYNREIVSIISVLQIYTLSIMTPIRPAINIKMNLETYGQILNAAYSYINLLLATRIST